jgi:hypothetical protein
MPRSQYPTTRTLSLYLQNISWNNFVSLLQLAFTEGMNNKLRQPLGNWYQGWISQAWNQVFSPEEHKIYFVEMEPS